MNKCLKPTCLILQHVVSYPFIVLRRQCQVVIILTHVYYKLYNVFNVFITIFVVLDSITRSQVGSKEAMAQRYLRVLFADKSILIKEENIMMCFGYLNYLIIRLIIPNYCLKYILMSLLLISM